MMTSRKDKQGRQAFPDTYGGGIGVERTLYAICRGPKLDKIDDITFFGKKVKWREVLAEVNKEG